MNQYIAVFLKENHFITAVKNYYKFAISTNLGFLIFYIVQKIYT